MTKNLKLAIFLSGRGSNARAIIESCEQPDFPAEIALVLSNNPEAKGLEFAQSKGLETICVNHRDYGVREAYDKALLKALEGRGIDMICLAGFMRILTPVFLEGWGGEIINIHPSLLPDYKGLNTHERALADGQKESGCTVHHVAAEMDSGPIIVQKRVPIIEGDTPGTLAARILEQEHIAYPEAISIIAQQDN